MIRFEGWEGWLLIYIEGTLINASSLKSFTAFLQCFC